MDHYSQEVFIAGAKSIPVITESAIHYSGTGLNAFKMLNAAVANCFPEKDMDDPFIKQKVLNAWVMVHGFATLWIDGPIRATYLGKPGIEELMKMLFKGSGLITLREFENRQK